MNETEVQEACDRLKIEAAIHSVEELRGLIACMDLTTLEGTDTPEKIRRLCAKAVAPPHAPSCAAVCVYPRFVTCACEALRGSKVKVASVAAGFPSGQMLLEIKLAEIRAAVASGSDEMDVVLDRGSFLSGDFAAVTDEIVAMKRACGKAPLKVILETGELGDLEQIRRASELAIEGGADFIKTSTGKIAPGATLPAVWVMCEAIREEFRKSGKRVGLKPAGGIRKVADAVAYVRLVRELLGKDWIGPELFRMGASSLLDAVLKEIQQSIA